MAVAPRLTCLQKLPDLCDPLHLLTYRRAPSVEFLAERHRDGVLEMGASHLQDILKLLALGEERIPEPAQLLHVAFQPQDQTEVECRRVDVVRGLPEVHVVVRIDVLVLSLLVAEALEGEVRDHLVGVHVDRGAGTALDEVGYELVEHLARDQPVARAHDRVGNLGVEDSEVAVRHGGGLLHVAERLDEIRLPGHRHVGDEKVLLAP